MIYDHSLILVYWFSHVAYWVSTAWVRSWIRFHICFLYYEIALGAKVSTLPLYKHCGCSWYIAFYQCLLSFHIRDAFVDLNFEGVNFWMNFLCRAYTFYMYICEAMYIIIYLEKIHLWGLRWRSQYSCYRFSISLLAQFATYMLLGKKHIHFCYHHYQHRASWRLEVCV